MKFAEIVTNALEQCDAVIECACDYQPCPCIGVTSTAATKFAIGICEG